MALRTGETDVEIFAAVLAHSNLTYTEAEPTSLDHGAPSTRIASGRNYAG